MKKPDWSCHDTNPSGFFQPAGFEELNKLKCFFDQPYKEFSVREFARITIFRSLPIPPTAIAFAHWLSLIIL